MALISDAWVINFKVEVFNSTFRNRVFGISQGWDLPWLLVGNSSSFVHVAFSPIPMVGWPAHDRQLHGLVRLERGGNFILPLPLHPFVALASLYRLSLHFAISIHGLFGWQLPHDGCLNCLLVLLH